jgi:hypothetical protein
MAPERNPTDALNQALSEQRVDGAEKTVLEIIAKTLEVDLAVVHRVIFAYEALRDIAWVRLPEHEEDWQELIPDGEVREALTKHMEAGARRYIARWAVEQKKEILVSPAALLTPANMDQICNGCPERMECVMESLHTPQECYGGRISRVLVLPLRIRKGKMDVEAKQPMGTFTVPLGAISLNHY